MWVSEIASRSDLQVACCPVEAKPTRDGMIDWSRLATCELKKTVLVATDPSDKMLDLEVWYKLEILGIFASRTLGFKWGSISSWCVILDTYHVARIPNCSLLSIPQISTWASLETLTLSWWKNLDVHHAAFSQISYVDSYDVQSCIHFNKTSSEQ